jgi:RpiR family transcriptional regulator, carbohydrate utilization regulator
MARVKHLAPSKAGCLIRIKSAMDSFKPSERMIAEFVLKNPERVVQMSISELARDVEVGESTVMRFCRAIDYKGYQEFKLRLAQDLVEPVEYIHEKIRFTDNIAQLALKTFQTNRSAVENTQKSLDPEMVEVAANALTEARRIDIYGAGYSFFTSLDAKLKFTRLGLLADAYGDAHLQAMAARIRGAPKTWLTRSVWLTSQARRRSRSPTSVRRRSRRRPTWCCSQHRLNHRSAARS